MSKRPSIKRLRDCLAYDPASGKLIWRIDASPHVKAGDEAGCASDGYVRICLDGVRMKAHRVIYAMVKGRWPKGLVDHEDRDGLNNRWTNLRAASDLQNRANSLRSNKSGLKGVYRMRDKFQAQIQCGGRRINLGTYPTPEEAHAAYAAKATELFGEFARAA